MTPYDLFLVAQADPNAQGNPFFGLAPILLIFIVFYFFIIRPQRKKDQERQEMISAVKKGDKVITIGGLHGTVMQVDDNSLLVQVDTNMKVRLEKTAVASVETK
ncbi:MAG: preprotein translocase subunit YajC [Bacteroidota bacterium]